MLSISENFLKEFILVISLLIISTTTMVIAGAGHHGNPEWKKLSHEIQDKVCSGKTTEQQLNDLRNCIEELKSENNNREKLEEDVQNCLEETETDIGFTVDDKHKESVYMICSGKFRMCMHQKLKNRPLPDDQEGGNDEDGDKRPPKFDEQKIQKMMECKRNALEL